MGYGRIKEIDKVAPELALTPKERLFATFIAEGKDATTASRLAGYKWHSYPNRVAQRERVMAYAKTIQAKNAKMMDMSRKRVMEGFLEAIEQAKLLSEPMTAVAGWREIAKMCGYYAPEVKRIDINVSAQRVLSTLETLSDADLLEMIEKDAETIEGEAREILTLEGPSESTGSDTGEDQREAEAGAGEPSAGEAQPDPVREAAVSGL